jgi:enoyl-CoA hydratase/carnithine racemase
MDSQAVAAHLEGGVLTLRLDRPEARNALPDEMVARLRDCKRALRERRRPDFRGR